VFQATGYPCKRAQNKELCDLSELLLGTNSKESAISAKAPTEMSQLNGGAPNNQKKGDGPE
jgi:hypothetical protein